MPRLTTRYDFAICAILALQLCSLPAFAASSTTADGQKDTISAALMALQPRDTLYLIGTPPDDLTEIQRLTS